MEDSGLSGPRGEVLVSERIETVPEEQEVMLPAAVRLLADGQMDDLQRFAQHNLGVDLGTVLIDCLIEILSDEDRATLTVAYQDQVATILGVLESNLNRMRLMQGVGVGPGAAMPRPPMH